jgi:hypothetical protein
MTATKQRFEVRCLEISFVEINATMERKSCYLRQEVKSDMVLIRLICSCIGVVDKVPKSQAEERLAEVWIKSRIFRIRHSMLSIEIHPRQKSLFTYVPDRSHKRVNVLFDQGAWNQSASKVIIRNVPG